MSASKKIFVGALLFAVGWTLQHYYVSRATYGAGLGLSEWTLQVVVEAQIAEDTREEQIIIRQEIVRGINANATDIAEAQKEIDDIRKDIYTDDETVEDLVDAEIKVAEAKKAAISAFQGFLTTMALAILLKIVGMILAITGCLGALGNGSTTKAALVSASVVALLGTHVMLNDSTVVNVSHLATMVPAGASAFLIGQSTRYRHEDVSSPSYPTEVAPEKWEAEQPAMPEIDAPKPAFDQPAPKYEELRYGR